MRLAEAESHHARDVLRLKPGGNVELFDDAGRTAVGQVARVDAGGVQITAGEVVERDVDAITWTIASAVPKGGRVDWMIEKLSELGTARFVPLMTQRSVVHPEGSGKRDRWKRIATEAAKQSRRLGVMAIDELTPLERVIEPFHTARVAGFYCATEVPDARPALMTLAAVAQSGIAPQIAVLIGPEGGWTPAELSLLAGAGLTAITLGRTILRVETAAVAVAALLASAAAAMPDPADQTQ